MHDRDLDAAKLLKVLSVSSSALSKFDSMTSKQRNELVYGKGYQSGRNLLRDNLPGLNHPVLVFATAQVDAAKLLGTAAADKAEWQMAHTVAIGHLTPAPEPLSCLATAARPHPVGLLLRYRAGDTSNCPEPATARATSWRAGWPCVTPSPDASCSSPAARGRSERVRVPIGGRRTATVPVLSARWCAYPARPGRP